MLNLFYSNKLEALASQLCAGIKVQPLPPLEPETIVVESAAMQFWLTKQLSCQLGISSNVRFPFPAALVWQIYRFLMPELPKKSRFDRLPLSLTLYDFFCSERCQKIPELYAYIQAMPGQEHIMQFAHYVADLFDQYQIYRPEWLESWSSFGPDRANDTNWQAILWRELNSPALEGDPDRATIQNGALECFPLEADKALPWGTRLNIFAVSTMPQAYLKLLLALSDSIEVNIYVLNPSAYFWQELQSGKQRHKALSEGVNQIDIFSDEQVAHNELLALMAKQGRDYVALLQEALSSSHHVYEENNCFVEVDETTVLESLQNDIVNLRQSSSHHKKICVPACDKSIQVHQCHSPLREVQVLFDQLLFIVDNHDDIKLDDIAIMVPDLESYTPFFHAVFGSLISGSKLSYHIAEKLSYEDQPLKRTLMQLLNLPATNFSREQVLYLLQEELVKNCFGFEDDNLLASLLDELGVVFGLDESSWASYGEDIVALSWAQAKERLINSFSVSEQMFSLGSDCLQGIYDDVAIESGRLCEFIDRLALFEKLKLPRTLAQWCDSLLQLLPRFIDVDDESIAYEYRQLLAVFEELKESSQLAHIEQSFSYEIFVDILEGQIKKLSQHHQFKAGAINITTLLPMRSIPFKVVCLLGLNEGEFPRPANTDSIDLMQQFPQKGDRNRREEDRYLFLEAILASRQYCYLSYIGKSHIDNSDRYPSLLLSELLAYLDSLYVGEDKVFSEQISTCHRLQAFHPDYFAHESKMFSYNAFHYKQAMQLLDENQQSTFVRDTVDCYSVEGDQISSDVDLYDFLRVIQQPALGLLNPLNVRPQLYDDTAENHERFSSDGLVEYELLNNLFWVKVAGEPLPAFDVLVRKQYFAQSGFGKVDYQRLLQQIDECIALMEKEGLAVELNSLTLEVNISDTFDKKGSRLYGELSNVNSQDGFRVAQICNRLHGKNLLKAWGEHLFLNASGCLYDSYILSAKEGVYRLNAVAAEEALDLLCSLFDLYTKSFNELTNFFPKSAFAYVCEKNKGNEEKALKDFRQTLLGGHQFDGEWTDLTNQYVYRGLEIDDKASIDASEKYMLPVMAYLELLDVTEEEGCQ